MAKMDQGAISERLTSLLAELSAGGVHCVILAAAPNEANGAITFGLETNATDRVVNALLKAGTLKMRESAEEEDAPLRRLM